MPEAGASRSFRTPIFASSHPLQSEPDTGPTVFHPIQKPFEALKPLIAVFCAAEEIVLDPLCGFGSMLVAVNLHAYEGRSAKNMTTNALQAALDRTVKEPVR
jgi:hypothetical protein